MRAQPRRLAGASSRSAASAMRRTRGGLPAREAASTGSTSPCRRPSSTSRRAARQRTSPRPRVERRHQRRQQRVGGGSRRASVQAAPRRWRGSPLRSARAQRAQHRRGRAPSRDERARRRARDRLVRVAERGGERVDEQHRRRIARPRRAGLRGAPRHPGSRARRDDRVRHGERPARGERRPRPRAARAPRARACECGPPTARAAGAARPGYAA